MSLYWNTGDNGKELMMKKTLCFVLSIVMLLSLTVTAFAAEPESDTPNPATFTENDGDYIGETQEGSERAIIYDPPAFKALRASYSGYEAHYTYNSNLLWVIFMHSGSARNLQSVANIWLMWAAKLQLLITH